MTALLPFCSSPPNFYPQQLHRKWKPPRSLEALRSKSSLDKRRIMEFPYRWLLQTQPHPISRMWRHVTSELSFTMSVQATLLFWWAIKFLQLGEIAANGIYTLEHDHPALYSVLSQIYGYKGVCSDITGLDKLMKKWRATKQKASRMCVYYEGF
ncbi:hypothetical protein RDI58_014337 [Solanum bulbocastanum]|uniref:Uncharacterized protein n=1 Tax=Solanum bulbocastanum TaxID=147425 RepID=A0AAN8TIU8_SOLBU